ncbi:DUF922 domain-containing protein [Rhizobiaceae bacterium n13]|uniref:DUF922 domain-containing protein n=1 Tax=Ferirhizobium litorale TaxID=2927786 RepID=A0AAE3QAR1_9HYPH|nr:DUF922 domain-containing protein [Fererhizobium litorale]MDI7860378.1 DUF922 domain-containing protein [Fererhizobium litorale]MDI7920513.1 DUF922 domain-containing protein [Fererhizobium litorale]
MTATAQADWRPVEKEQTYAVSGKTGLDLYRSIGERGPKVGIGRAIAYTSFKLTWRRNYQPQGDSCVLVSAVPNLIITYTLPKPAERLPASTQRHWETFMAGVRSHERVHGDIIEDMVRQIEAISVGLSVAGDPGCKKIRVELTRRLGELSLAQRQRSRDFDAVELGNGGNIHQLVLALVNGG